MHMEEICSVIDPANSGLFGMLAYIARSGCHVLGSSFDNSYVIALGIRRTNRMSVLPTSGPVDLVVESVMMVNVDKPYFARMFFVVGDDGWTLNYHTTTSDSYMVIMQDGRIPFALS